jgi:hypothetical protein
MEFGTLALFETDFPDDSEWEPNGNLLKPGGENVISCLAELLRGRGMNCSGATQHSFYGWRIDAISTKYVVRCILQGGDPWVLICDVRPSGLQKIFGQAGRRILYEFVLEVHNVLKNEPRITGVRWFTREQYEKGTIRGAGTPRLNDG